MKAGLQVLGAGLVIALDLTEGRLLRGDSATLPFFSTDGSELYVMQDNAPSVWVVDGNRFGRAFDYSNGTGKHAVRAWARHPRLVSGTRPAP